MTVNQIRQLSLTVVGGMILTLCGCGWKSGPARVAIEGVVLVSGAPLKNGRIMFIPIEETRGPSAVAHVVDGEFRFTSRNGPVAGSNKVQIESIVDIGFALDDEQSFANAVKEKEGTREQVIPRQPIPPEYNDQTELLVEISTEKSRHYEFQLEGPAGGILDVASN